MLSSVIAALMRNAKDVPLSASQIEEMLMSNLTRLQQLNKSGTKEEMNSFLKSIGYGTLVGVVNTANSPKEKK